MGAALHSGDREVDGPPLLPHGRVPRGITAVMGFFKSSKSHLEDIQERCSEVSKLSQVVRDTCDRSLRGKYEYMRPEERADLVRAAHLDNEKLHAALEKAKARQSTMEADQCPSEDVLAAESIMLSATLDATQAQKALNEAHHSLVQGVSEVEQFYGPRSREAKHLRKVLAQFQASA